MLKKIVFSVFLLMFVFSYQTGFSNERYQWIVSNDKVGYFFDTHTIKFGKDFYGNTDYQIIDVWIKDIFNANGVNKEMHFLIKNNIPTEGFEDLDHRLVHAQFKVNTKQSKYLTYNYYNKSGELLLSLKGTQNWEEITPNTYEELFLTTFVEYALYNWEVVKFRSN